MGEGERTILFNSSHTSHISHTPQTPGRAVGRCGARSASKFADRTIAPSHDRPFAFLDEDALY
ncbi:MAG: hypothetical protein F6J93_15360 [Oscillatoria sp. SIO1A7]|nr:hypothetical protein [Oscillatoria sp. SIO1A7]